MATGWILEDASYDPESGEFVQMMTECPICKSVGAVSVDLYGPRQA